MKGAVRKDVVVVVPCTPAAPPRVDAPAAAHQKWLQRCHAFAALPALGGCPSVVVPVSLPGDPPLAVALFGQVRSDLRLLAVAERLTPFVKVGRRPTALSGHHHHHHHCPNNK
jgi:Asp-tRNA(Asn)/Glu-tRNA(Gln) amidotransferase A subunit family amidase